MKSTSTQTKPTNAFSPVGEITKQSNSDIRVDYNFPIQIDPSQRYLFYLHGKIIEDQGLPAISPEFCEYKYGEILDMLQSHGFVVISEQRSRDTDGVDYALRVTTQVRKLLNAEVHPGSISVVGASKGAAIATLVSNFVGNHEVNYVRALRSLPPTPDRGVEATGYITFWKRTGDLRRF